MAADKKTDQYVLLDAEMALKYVLLEIRTLLQLRGDGARRNILANL